MQTVKLNLIPGSVMPVVNVSQYDVKRQFALSVYEGATAYDLTGKSVEIRGTKPDGNGFAYDAQDGVVSVSGNIVTISTTQQMTAVGGQTMAELRIKSGTTILGTSNFILDVEHSALSDDTPISETEIPVIERQLEELVEEVQVYTEDAEAWAVGERDGEPVPSSDPTYHNNAKYYASNALSSASTATTKAGEAARSATNASNSATTAGNAATTATTKAEEASTSATNAGNSATAAAGDSLEAEGWATGEQNGVPVGPTSPYYQNNAAYYAAQAGQYAAGGLIFQGSIFFADLPTTGMSNGDEYNIKDDFTTDSRFIEEAGLSVKAGTDIAWVGGNTNKWNVLATGGGGGVGDAETATGNPLSFTTDSEQVASNTVVTLDPIQSGSGDPSPNNIRPISGYDKVDVSSPVTDITINLNNTVYGGTLDVESGELIVTHKVIDMGDLSWNYASNVSIFRGSDKNILGSIKQEGNINDNFLCSCYKPVSKEWSAVGNNECVLRIGVTYDGYYTLCLKDTRYTDAASIKTAVTGQKIAFELANPITYHLAPHQVKLLQGANTVTTNGTSLSLTYRKGEVAKLSDLDGLADSVNSLAPFSQKVAGLQKTGCINRLQNTAISAVYAGITYTVNANKSVTTGGIATAQGSLTINEWVSDGSMQGLKLVGCPAGGSNAKYHLGFYNVTKGTETSDFGDGAVINNDFAGDTVRVHIRVRNGADLSTPVTFNPMLTPDLSATYADYAPFSMTNRELTEKVTGNTFGTFVDATSLLPYTIPSDGYITAGAKGSSSYMYARIKDANNVDGPECYAIGAGTDTWMQSSVFVRKGMIVYSTGNSGTGRVRFYPINN